MTDQQHAVGVAREIAFEPDRCLQIEMVCRFVEQQQIGSAEETGREGDPHPPPTRKGIEGTPLLGFVEAESGQNTGRPGRRGMGVDLL